jgi:choline monooxygenase
MATTQYVFPGALMLTARHVDDMNQPLEKAVPLPGFAYCDPGFMKEETARVLQRNWISIGFGQQVKSPGEIVPVTVAGQPLIIVRDAAGALRVFHNVCRHRGAQLVDARCTQTGAITCPYHRWTYGLDGRCLGIPFWYRNEQKPRRPAVEDDYGLIEVRSAVWLDTIFIDLSGQARPFEQVISPLDKRWRVPDIGPLHQAATWEGLIPANWKLVVENFLDTYHAPFVHPQVGPMSVQIAHERPAISPDIIGQRCIDAAVNKPRTGPIPVIPALESVLGADDETYSLFPNTLLFVQRSFVSVRCVVPRSVDSSYTMNAVYLSSNAMTDDFNADRQRLQAAVALVNDQDVGILVRLQATKASLAADRGRFVPDWDFMSHQFQVRLAQEMQA